MRSDVLGAELASLVLKILEGDSTYDCLGATALRIGGGPRSTVQHRAHSMVAQCLPLKKQQGGEKMDTCMRCCSPLPAEGPCGCALEWGD